MGLWKVWHEAVWPRAGTLGAKPAQALSASQVPLQAVFATELFTRVGRNLVSMWTSNPIGENGQAPACEPLNLQGEFITKSSMQTVWSYLLRRGSA